ncbi:hypothetical protein GX408_10605 [bacterium]|nr:hypothetical protein [bacterium]
MVIRAYVDLIKHFSLDSQAESKWWGGYRHSAAAAPSGGSSAAGCEGCFTSHESGSISQLELFSPIFMIYIPLDFIEWIGYYSAKPVNGQGFCAGPQ